MNGDDDTDHPLGRGLAGILSLTGINVPSRAFFVGEAVVSASLSSLTIGLVCGGIGASMFPVTVGPLVPYMVGSSIGYTFGLWQYWSSCKRTTLWYAQQYPTVLAHAMWTDRQTIVPAAVVRASQEKIKERGNGQDKLSSSVVTLEQWIFQGGLGRMTWSILAAQHCRADVVEIQRQERQRVVEGVLGEEHYQ